MKWETPSLRLPFLREYLSKWVDLDPFKYTMDGIRIFASKLLRVFQRVRFDDDKTPCFIRERTGEHNLALGIEGLHLSKMRRAINFSLGFSIGTVKSKNDKFHTGLKC